MDQDLICRACGSTDVMRMPRKTWERAFPLAAYWCRRCGNRFRTPRPADDEPGDGLLVPPELPENIRAFPLDKSVPHVLEGVAPDPARDVDSAALTGNGPIPY